MGRYKSNRINSTNLTLNSASEKIHFGLGHQIPLVYLYRSLRSCEPALLDRSNSVLRLFALYGSGLAANLLISKRFQRSPRAPCPREFQVHCCILHTESETECRP